MFWESEDTTTDAPGNAVEADVLTEIASIASGNASSALSNALGKEVDIKIPALYVVIPEEVGDIAKLVVGPKELVVGTYTPVRDCILGNIVFILPRNDALLLMDLMGNRKSGDTRIMGKKEEGMIKKIGAALSRSYLNAITQFLNIKKINATSKVISTFGESIADFVLLGIREENRSHISNPRQANFAAGPKINSVSQAAMHGKNTKGLLLMTEFSVASTPVRGKFVLMLAAGSIVGILGRVKGHFCSIAQTCLKEGRYYEFDRAIRR